MRLIMKNNKLLLATLIAFTTPCFGMRIMHPHLIRAALSQSITPPKTVIFTSSKNTQNQKNSKKAINTITTASVVAFVGLTAAGASIIDTITQ